MKTQVLIIGGGATGTAIARDLALRGVQSILVEQADINSGASGANHGLLHSGGRYVSNDQDAATECMEEGKILKRLASQCIEDTGGIFVAVPGDDEKYIADFPGYCKECNVPVYNISTEEARELEPQLSDKIIAAYRVEDASIDPFKLSLQNISHAMKLGSSLIRRTKVVGFEKDNGRIIKTFLVNTETGKEMTIEADQVVNAAGAWAGEVATMAGAHIDMIYSKGTLLITNNRITNWIVNRLRPPSNADILVPGGTVSILGTTSIKIKELKDIYPMTSETDTIVEECAKMTPALNTTRFIRAFSGVRPLVGSPNIMKGNDDRAVSRGFTLLDHEEDKLKNFTTITGGKLTTFRLMAEKISDIVCEKLGVKTPCLTTSEPLPPAIEYEWTEPGKSPKKWLKEHKKNDMLICDCEMVSKTALDNIITSLQNNSEDPKVVDIGLRSRIGRGACQGAFCGSRTVSYLYDQGKVHADEGLNWLVNFYKERWKGVYSILWGNQLIQAELMEAMHCGLFGQELVNESQGENDDNAEEQ